MISKQRIAAIFILLAGFTFAFATVLGERGQKETAALVSILEKDKSGNPNLAFTSLNHPTTAAAASAPEESLNLVGNNLTELLARSYINEVFNQNPNGMQNAGGQTRLKIPSINTLGSSLDNAIANQSLEIPKFAKKDIKLLADNPEAQKLYIESLDKTLRKNFSWLKKDIIQIIKNFTESGTNKDLDLLLETIPNFINDLLEIPAPNSMSATHIEFLNLWQKKLTTYQAIKNMNTDPLMAYLALQQIPEIILEDTNLQSVLIERYKELTN